MSQILSIVLLSLLVSLILFLLAFFIDGLPRPVTLIDFYLLLQLSLILFFFLFLGTVFETLSLLEHAHFIQVLTQFSCFIFNFKYASEKARLLLNFFFFGSVMTTLFFTVTEESQVAFFSVGLLLFLIFLFFLPSRIVHFLVFIIYLKNEPLFEWSFYLSFQVIVYFIITIILEREKGSETKNLYVQYLFLCLVQTYLGLFFFNKFFCSNYLKLAAMVSKAFIIFLCIERETRAFR